MRDYDSISTFHSKQSEASEIQSDDKRTKDRPTQQVSHFNNSQGTHPITVETVQVFTQDPEISGKSEIR
jgi:hypothetical protein